MTELRWWRWALLGGVVACGVSPEAAVVSSSVGSGVANPGVVVGDDGEVAPGLDGGQRPPGNGIDEPGTCAQQEFRTRVTVPEILILLDRSASMQQGSVDRWTPAVRAIKSLTSAFEGGVDFGLMTFPGSGSTCAPGEMEVPVGATNAANIARELASSAPSGATPTGESLQAALAAFRASGAASSQSPRYVLLVTDGQPSCPTAQGYVGRTEAMEADRQLALQAIDALRAEGVQTFVLGYDASLEPGFATSLTEFAVHGGTDQYYLVQDEVSLQLALDKIADGVISCNFDFDTPVVDPALLRVTLNGEVLRPDDPNGWSIQGRRITIRGSSCARLQQGKDQSVQLTLECRPVVYL